MKIEAVNGFLLVKGGSRFGAPDAQRLAEAARALGPFTHFSIDFSRVREFEDAAFTPLAELLAAFPGVQVALRGLTAHQERMLRYIQSAPPAPVITAAAPPPAADPGRVVR